mmetsp:Transcript_57360/g.134279  ORF Transcript_57360/g.134279 Transcript_57360/m.134279 type:complete len:391 (-) Transcript_57360:165-1337(-)
MGNFGSCHVRPGEHARTHVAVRRKRLVQALLVLGLASAGSSQGSLSSTWMATPMATYSQSWMVRSHSSSSRPQFVDRGCTRRLGRSCRPLTQPTSETSSGAPEVWSNAAETFLELLVYSTLWMSFSLASLVPFVQLECGARLDWRPFWAAASESIAVYTLDHLRDVSKGTSVGAHKLSPRSGLAVHRRRLQALFVASVLGLVCSLLAAKSWLVSLTFVGHVGLCAAYAKLKPRMPYCKAFYVSLCVVFMAVAAPCAYAPALLSSLGPASLSQLLLLIFSVALTVEQLQDIRDVDEDLEAQVVTLPIGLGLQKARRLLLAFQAATFAAHVIVMRLAQLPLRPNFLGVHAACGLCALAFTANTPRTLFQVLLEPLYALPLLMTLFWATAGYA